MRLAPAAAALSLALALTASVSWGASREPSPHAATLIAQGDAALAKGEVQGAIDAYEAALAVDPAYAGTLVKLAEAARRDGLQGKAITYYHEALAREPRNFAALAGEGAALVERGALEKARAKLAELEAQCGKNCPETAALAAAISAGPKPRMANAEPGPAESKAPVAN